MFFAAHRRILPHSYPLTTGIVRERHCLLFWHITVNCIKDLYILDELHAHPVPTNTSVASKSYTCHCSRTTEAALDGSNDVGVSIQNHPSTSSPQKSASVYASYGDWSCLA